MKPYKFYQDCAVKVKVESAQILIWKETKKKTWILNSERINVGGKKIIE